jgi:sugar-specific transcriptional regulator TrmB
LKKGTITETLRNFGLTEKEAEVYVFLGKQGPLKRVELSKLLKMNKGQVYRTLKRLQNKGLVESTLEHPIRFTAVPFENVIDSFIKSKREEVDLIEESKNELLADWKKISQTELESSLERFSVIEGEKKIFQKISQMIKESKKQLVSILSVYGLRRAAHYGIFENILNHPLESKVKFRFLTQLKKDDLKPIKHLLSKMESGPDFEGRDPERSSSIFPRMVIKDNEEILLFISDENIPTVTRKIEAVLCTNCKSIIQSFNSVFRDLWNKSLDLEKRIGELETGKPVPSMELIKDPRTAKKNYYEKLNRAKKQILMVTSSGRLNGLAKNSDLLKKWCSNGVSIRIMAPITCENLKATQTLLEIGEVRHIPVGYRETTIIDDQNLFQFNNPCANDTQDCEVLNLENVFFTNDLNYLKQTKKMLFEVWKKTHTPPKEGIRSIRRHLSPKKLPSVHHPILKKRAYNVDIKYHKFGAISEKDVLDKINKERIFTSRENLEKYDIMKYFGQRAFAMIHLPESLLMPKMIIGLFKDDKDSSSKGQNYMVIDLLQESTYGEEYVPVAIIQDTPELMDSRKKELEGLPIGNNVQLINKTNFQIQVKGNTLFAGWTVPIPLLSKYVLPPACILFEGYGEIKSGMFTSDTLVKRKYEIWYNSLDTFVSFFLPQFKYTGSGTEGFFDIESVWISKAC